ncbi:uncharacterized protein K452DRAFT_271217 [Aplosporella prunicola CBS 121167]|uniref:(2E,6E)-farnesyl diphosphate synthase n=1 Tax=Aplosporella prunicola CBS 121167 TaxID=1176127 RepID=A0A6A6BBI8_9PEZI|nr:uncharacterized protein K452DRAFT_271217 [Aplosporella prunicola CBS 121167]KAF2141602.1 hypothetical protein K452DRAFT_271217 [Aplosporella prunicola CBS 121167]
METPFERSLPVSPEEAQKTGSFTTLPIRRHQRNDLADAASYRFIKDWATHVGDGREKKTHFSFSPVGNWSALIYPEAIPERLGILTYLSDLGLIHDDAGEELSVEEAQVEHDDLHAALDPNDRRELAASSKAMKMKKLVSQCMLECITLDRELGLQMLAAFRDLWLAISEKDSDKEAQTLEEYFQQRRDNGGMLVFWPMLQFSMALHMSKDDHVLVKPAIDAATEGLLLANDWFSWEREVRELQSGKSQRIVSAVELLIRTKGLSTEQAKDAVKDMIITAERNYCLRRDELYRTHPGISTHIKKWIDCAGLAVSGNHFWCSACPRQNAWRSEHLEDHGKKSERAVINNKRLCVTPEPEASNKRTRKDSGASEPSAVMPEPKTPFTPVSPSTKLAMEVDHSSPSHRVCQYPAYKPSSLAIKAPSTYISSMPSKGVRSTLIEALNTWLHVPPGPLKTIMSVVNNLHNASLILDDIEDNSPLRRGKPAAHAIFGQAQAINSANFMFVQATQDAAKKFSAEGLTALLEELEGLYLGQSWDLYYKYNLICPTEVEYINMVDHKTGGMFKMLLRLMQAESALVDTSVLPSFEKLTLLFGRFFQIRDDYMNFGDYAASKGFCEDLDEGKFSFPIVYCLENHPEYRGHILGIFRQRPTAATNVPCSLSKESKQHLMECLKKSEAFSETLECLMDMERELESEIERLEHQTGETNPLLRLCLARLSMKGTVEIR